ncbi:hypothetical protein N6H18_03295 [Reichenbachiella agarivorans]|uniref:Uncharacterized protein n=1 Tax=Reichenbachiella agarivorans TaxID=2979464 RepID=A0ABY6CSL2_9BACT|nr:hypothetical protein [Reichenbachiella agarivorans]UXP32980.1 hypothetical protein N6H18_03295 [Reichenbachiella agarivorans]
MKNLITAIIFSTFGLACTPKSTHTNHLCESIHSEYVFWGRFQQAIEDSDEKFLLSHLQPIVVCDICEGVESDSPNITATDMIKHHLRILKAPQEADYQITIEKNGESSIYHINYSIKCRNCPEGTYNLIYNLEESKGDFRLTDIFSVP